MEKKLSRKYVADINFSELQESVIAIEDGDRVLNLVNEMFKFVDNRSIPFENVSMTMTITQIVSLANVIRKIKELAYEINNPTTPEVDPDDDEW